MRWLVAAVAVLGFACHSAPPPAEPVPVSSTGTPIGWLIDDNQLGLSAQQLGTLRGIDENLHAELETLDKTVPSGSAAPAPPQQPQPQPQPMGRHRRGMGGMGGMRPSSGSPHAAGAQEAAADRSADAHMHAVKVALEHVLAVLDPNQQARAKQVLSDHDIDIALDPAPAPSSDDDDESAAPVARTPSRFPRPPAPSSDAPVAPPPTLPPPASSDDEPQLASPRPAPSPAAPPTLPPPPPTLPPPPPTLPPPPPTLPPPSHTGGSH